MKEVDLGDSTVVRSIASVPPLACTTANGGSDPYSGMFLKQANVAQSQRVVGL